jgi:hypothetical protein
MATFLPHFLVICLFLPAQFLHVTVFPARHTPFLHIIQATLLPATLATCLPITPCCNILRYHSIAHHVEQQVR